MLEKTVVKNIMYMLKLEFPGLWFKVHGGPFQVAGLPDILGCHKGKFIGIEVKAPGKEKTLTLIQQEKIAKIKLAGGIAFMATSATIVRSVLNEQLRKPQGNMRSTGRVIQTKK